MRRLLLAVITLLALLAPGRAFATTPPGSDGTSDGAAGATTTTIDNSFLDTKRELSQCLNNSIDLPDCGIEPKVAGDRGGSLQLITFGVLALGIAFICWRVTRAIRARDAALQSRVS